MNKAKYKHYLIIKTIMIVLLSIGNQQLADITKKIIKREIDWLETKLKTYETN